MKLDPFTLRVALDKDGNARGDLYLDDGESYDHQEGNFIWREFVAEKKTRSKLVLESKDLGASRSDDAVYGVSLAGKYDEKNAFVKAMEGVRVEKVE
jgi:mannosyl-oligosaccharide alpha-1,3-glucosidase